MLPEVGVYLFTGRALVSPGVPWHTEKGVHVGEGDATVSLPGEGAGTGGRLDLGSSVDSATSAWAP